MSDDAARRVGMPRWLKFVLLAVVIAIAIVVLFSWVFPWVESWQQDPTLGGLEAAVAAVPRAG